MSQDDKQNLGVDLGEFLEFYLLDSQEQIEKLAAGLLQLEKEGNNLPLINDLFRSAHSLKGASGTMGFTSIVALTHSAEDLLDRLRQGKMEVTYDVIDLLLAVTDRVKEMLEQVEKREEISVEYQDLVEQMQALLSGEVISGTLSQEGEKPLASEEKESFNIVDFELPSEQLAELKESQDMGNGVYQVNVKFAPETLMKAVRAVMAVQRIESMGKVIKLRPTVEELEASNDDSFAMLILSNEPVEDIQVELLNISELEEIEINPYPFGALASGEVAAATSVGAVAEVVPEDMGKDSVEKENNMHGKEELEEVAPVAPTPVPPAAMT